MCANVAGITTVLGEAHFAIDAYDWLTGYVRSHVTPPCNKIIGRFLAALDCEALEALLRNCAARHSRDADPFAGLPNAPLRHLAVDGKAVRGRSPRPRPRPRRPPVGGPTS